jgi:phenylalanyl-tRNA synthetase alpha chain
MPETLTPTQLTRDLAVRDLTDPAAGPHALQLVVEWAVAATAGPRTEVRRWPGDRIVTVADNYDNLGYAAADVTRDARYTRYVDADHVLRSHSSALVPAALRALKACPADDVLLVCPGIVYRRDSIDRLHTGTPHQLDLWRITRTTKPDLDRLVEGLVTTLLPGRRWRLEPRRHPYTVDGAQLDVRHHGEWIEIAECGLAHPDVLARAGLGDGWSGLALGMGLDRMLMLLKDIPDIRLLRSPHPAVAAQLTDLASYRPVSPLPPVRRDLSIAVAHDDRAEDLGDRVRTALGDDADVVESVEIVQETPCAQLPPQALARLGATADQKNLLVRLVLRPLDTTLSDREANVLRDRAYAALHQGSGSQPPKRECGEAS